MAVYNRFAKTPDFKSGDEGEVRLQSSADIEQRSGCKLGIKKTADFQSAEVYKGPEGEPNFPVRNPIDSFFKEVGVNATAGTMLGPAILIAAGAVVGGVYEGVSEGIRAYSMISAQNFAEAIRSGLAVLGSGVVVAAGVKVLESANYVLSHPNYQRLYDYHRNLSATWNESTKAYWRRGRRS